MSTPGLNVATVKQVATECKIEIAQSLTLAVRKARYGKIPEQLHRHLLTTLQKQYPAGLYLHQSQALEAFLSGQDVALSTSTASGKSLVFITAAMDILYKDPFAKILALYPAKALIRDQLDKWESATNETFFGVGYIDGNVPIERRQEILKTKNVVLMTPDVAHAWMMSNLRGKQVAKFRAAMRLLILDEAHVYDGVFGTNMAYLLRRLDSVTKGYRVLCSTATLGRPSDFVYQLTGRHPVSIDQENDGSPAPERHVLLARDPGYDRIVELLKRLAAVDGARFLAFSDSRKMVEQLVAATMRLDTSASNDDSDSEDIEDDSDERSTLGGGPRILPYRAGYEAEDAKEIHSALWHGKLGGVVSTSAMELGLDIGEIDLVVMLGMPPSVKGFWQRLGRAGRRRDGVCLVIDTKGAITSMHDGLSRYVERPLDPSWLYLDNRYLQYTNVLCAALECSELGLASATSPAFDTLPAAFKQLLENEINPTEVVPADLYPLKQRAQAGPHREFPLRSGIEKDFRVRTSQGLSLGNVTFSQMLREAYPGAVYYYMARPYRVVRIDMRDGNLLAQRTKYWTTRPNANTIVFPKFNGGVLALYGSVEAFIAEAELQVSERVSGFQETRGRTKMPVQKYGPTSEWYRRDLNRFFETTGVCLSLPTQTGSTEEIGIRIVQAFCLDFGVQDRDIGLGLYHAKQDPFGDSKTCQGLCIYDAVDGSLRLTQRLGGNFSEVVQAAATYAKAEGATDMAAELRRIARVVTEMSQVSVNVGTTVQAGSTLDNWTEIVAPGEKAMYASEDGTREVTVIGSRFTPKGLMYELLPEKDKGNGKWMVANYTLQPLNGFTRMIWVDLFTGEERDKAPETAKLAKT